MSRCADCGFLFTSQRNVAMELYDELYDGNPAYAAMKRAADRAAEGTHGLAELWWSKRFAFQYLEARLTGRSLLDVGCGPGEFLLVARRRGWSASGVEPAPEAARQSASYGLEVFEGILEAYAAQTDRRFDAITAFEVCEHVPDPLSVLDAMASLLKPDGLLLLSVPNLDDPYVLHLRNAASIPPVHINFFNRRSMAQALTNSGLQAERFKTLPVPTYTARLLHGKLGWLVRLPWLGLLSLVGRADGSTLVTIARRQS
jgi:2-polyprenyl-3-methyl-5-hydroxy-6-metoxy-1,4-benzoquinol methylase